MSKKATTPRGSNAFGGFRFISYSLGQAEKEELAEIYERGEFPLELVFDFLQDGYKVSFSNDAEHHAFICSITDVREGSPTAKHILTGRGSTPLAAWYAVCYRHYRIAAGDWANIIQPEGKEGSMFG